jgi:dephospho-CoA kinase
VAGLGLSSQINGWLRIGLTGGIGSGKSTAAALLAEAGLLVVDTDAIARQLTAAGGAALPAIASAFGAQFLGPEGLDRAALRQRVFADPAARQQLEQLLHPLIQQQAEAQAAGAERVVFDVPLLVESGHWRARVDRVLLIDCDEAVQRQRVLQRPGWTAAQLDGVLAAQATRAQRRLVADAVIDNSALPLESLREQLLAVLRHWTPVEESAA